MHLEETDFLKQTIGCQGNLASELLSCFVCFLLAEEFRKPNQECWLWDLFSNVCVLLLSHLKLSSKFLFSWYMQFSKGLVLSWVDYIYMWSSLEVLAALFWRFWLSIFYLAVFDASFLHIFCLVTFHIFGRDTYLLFAVFTWRFHQAILNFITT